MKKKFVLVSVVDFANAKEGLRKAIASGADCFFLTNENPQEKLEAWNLFYIARNLKRHFSDIYLGIKPVHADMDTMVEYATRFGDCIDALLVSEKTDKQMEILQRSQAPQIDLFDRTSCIEIVPFEIHLQSL